MEDKAQDTQRISFFIVKTKDLFFYCKNHSESWLVEQRNYGS